MGSTSCTCVCSRNKVTPLPWRKLLVVCSALFVNMFGMNMIFPFLPFMIHDFFPYLDKSELGKKAGYLASAYSVGSLGGSFLWGWISDRIGRRPVILFGLFGTIASELLFGFSQNYGWAVAARFLWGLLNANLGVGKSYVAEICDDTNQSRGFATLGTCGGLAKIFGSITGGFLAQPASKYRLFESSIFCTYPYLLPCIVGAVLCTASLCVGFVFLDETLKRRRNPKSVIKSNSMAERESVYDSGIELRSYAMDNVETSTKESTEDLYEFDSFFADTEDTDVSKSPPHEVAVGKSFTNVNQSTNFENHGHHGEYSFCAVVHKVLNFMVPASIVHAMTHRKKFKYTPGRKIGSNNFCDLVVDRRVILSTILYGVTSFIGVISEELLPLFLVTSYIHGGYNMDDNEIGIILMGAAFLQLFWQFFIFPCITDYLGYRHALKFGLLLYAITCFVLPFSNKIASPIVDDNGTYFLTSGSDTVNATIVDYCGNKLDDVETTSVHANSVTRVPASVWIVTCSIVGFIVVARIMSFASYMVLIANSSVPDTRGTVNGIAQSLAALGRSIGPVVGGPLFAWSASSGKTWPLNYHFVFDCIALTSLFLAACTFLLPKSIEKKREFCTHVSN